MTSGWGTQTPITCMPQCGSRVSTEVRSAAAYALPTTMTRRTFLPVYCWWWSRLRNPKRPIRLIRPAIGVATTQTLTSPGLLVTAEGTAPAAIDKIMARSTARISSSPTPMLVRS